MARKPIEMAGRRYGQWVVLSREGTHPKHQQATWVCRCDCGTERVLLGGSLRQGLSTSCGDCLDRSALRTTHGLSYTRAYQSWQKMLKRCTDPEDKDFHHYGGRGISVCSEWRDVREFVREMGEPAEGETLERLDVDLGYEPDNCVWASRVIQTRNARSNINLTYRGETRCLGEWAEHVDLPYSTLYARVVTRGWDVARAFTTPVRK